MFCTPLYNSECYLVSEKYNNQNQTCFVVCWGRKDPPNGNILTQQTDFLPTARKLLKIFVPITTRASNTRGFAESDLINLIPNRICDCMVLLNHTTPSCETWRNDMTKSYHSFTQHYKKYCCSLLRIVKYRVPPWVLNKKDRVVAAGHSLMRKFWATS